MAEYTLTIKLISVGSDEVKLSTKGDLQGSPSIYFALFIKSFQEQVQNSLQGKGAIASEIAELSQRIANCVCDDDG
ncbi:hypothetical protein [Xenorhabdus anantnagensis]|uniref:Uncharacterized protein n=1 Tax=Xenorhabdus anantnagensis TaxID=3025875 RepID=A0ABT5LX72_9GAMM|nr:hypothetical protein [Xenorhabdus anantnagensis]MDC9599051.1 hypothetical protein [Xenorhabdus anantnagensis]